MLQMATVLSLQSCLLAHGSLNRAEEPSIICRAVRADTWKKLRRGNRAEILDSNPKTSTLNLYEPNENHIRGRRGGHLVGAVRSIDAAAALSGRLHGCSAELLRSMILHLCTDNIQTLQTRR